MPTAHIVTVPDDTDFDLYFKARQIKLASIPRTGEYFTISDRDDKARAFEVVAVIHPTDPRPGTATVELRVRYVGSEAELFTMLNVRVK